MTCLINRQDIFQVLFLFWISSVIGEYQTLCEKLNGFISLLFNFGRKISQTQLYSDRFFLSLLILEFSVHNFYLLYSRERNGGCCDGYFRIPGSEKCISNQTRFMKANNILLHVCVLMFLCISFLSIIIISKEQFKSTLMKNKTQDSKQIKTIYF